MKITVIGAGYVGLTSGAVFAQLGHRVTCVDKDRSKVAALNRAEAPFYEPGLDELIKNHLNKNLFFTSGLKSAREAEAVMIAVGTPPAADGSPDLTFVLEAAGQLVPYLAEYKVLILKSTVPVGTSKKVREFLCEQGVPRDNFDIVSNPEFLREGTAVHDSFHQDRIVIGADCQRAVNLVRSLYQGIECIVMVTSNEAAEMIKYAANCFLAAKISFINEIALICETCGIDVNEVARGIGYDSRIGAHFLRAGAGYGGSCLPKDLDGLLYLAEKTGKPARILQAVKEVNASLPEIVVDKAEKLTGGLKGKKVALWGLAFKPETDDMRFAPSIPVSQFLIRAGAEVFAYDPVAAENARRVVPRQVQITDDMYEAVKAADALIVMTEWKVFQRADLQVLKETMKKPVIVDGRNVFDPVRMRGMGFQYQGMGR